MTRQSIREHPSRVALNNGCCVRETAMAASRGPYCPGIVTGGDDLLIVVAQHERALPLALTLLCGDD